MTTDQTIKELSVQEAAALEDVHEQTVRDWIRKGAVPAFRRPGGSIRLMAQWSETRRRLVLMTQGESKSEAR